MKTAAFLGEKEAITLSHPPYSPDIAPSDFFLFGYLKSLIKGRNFGSSDELIASLREIYAMISKDMLMNVLRGGRSVFLTLLRTMESIIIDGKKNNF